DFLYLSPLTSSLFFITHPATPEIYTLSLHDALPILRAQVARHEALEPDPRVPDHAPGRGSAGGLRRSGGRAHRLDARRAGSARRSEEHTSELQSLTNLVCRLLLEKKKREATKSTNTT